ncbi:MAG: hypothetical protein Q9186_003884 [Xanthomendoza sp. 1 TL-2023]
MGVLLKRSELTDNVSAKASSGWSSCMSKPMCKWPAILAILLAILLLLTLIYFTLRCLSCCCCNCLSGGRYQRNKRKQYKYADLHSSPYNNNNNNNTVYQPSHGAPPQYAQFDHASRGGDSLPAMPSWNEGKDRRVYDEGLRKDVEMGKLEREGHFEQRLPMLSTNNSKHDPVPGYAEMDGNQGGDLGQPRPYGQAYMAYSPVVGGRSV